MPLFGKSKPKPSAARVEQALRSSAPKSSERLLSKRNRRQLQRLDTWQRCVLISDMGIRLDGILLDYSRSGGRVRFRTYQTLPAGLTLKVPALGINKRVEAVWQSRGDAGLSFL